MHRRLVTEKAQLERRIADGVEAAFEEVQARLQARNFADADDLDKLLSSQLQLREVAANVST